MFMDRERGICGCFVIWGSSSVFGKDHSERLDEEGFKLVGDLWCYVWGKLGLRRIRWLSGVCSR